MVRNNKEEFKPNDLVMGQLRGYPWWPGYIMSRESSGDFRVVFFGDFTYAVLNRKKIKPFSPANKNTDKKNQKLLQAMRCAQRILRRETTILEERDAVLRVLLKPPPVKSKRVNKRGKAQARKAEEQKPAPRKDEPRPKKESISKTKKIKKPDSRGKARGAEKTGQSSKRQKRRNRSVQLELVNDSQDISDLLGGCDLGGESHSLGHRTFIKSRRLKNKLNMSLGFKDPMESGMAMSERGKKSDSRYIDDLTETKSMKPSDNTLGFNLLPARMEPIEALFKAKGSGDSPSKILNRTKGSVASFEQITRLLEDSDPIRRDSGFDSDLLALRKDPLLNPEVIELDPCADSKSSTPLLKCPSVSSKGLFSFKQSQVGDPGSLKSLPDSGKADFKKIETEMQEFLDEMQKGQSSEQLEERLQEWYLRLRLKPDFKLIVMTKIGRYLSDMRDFCHARINETQHFDGMLSKIKAFERVLIEKISKTFFGVEQDASLLLTKEGVSWVQNPSPASKDLTLLNQSFPSPKFDRNEKLAMDLRLFYQRKHSLQNSTFIHSKPSQATKQDTLEFPDDSLLEKFKPDSPEQSSLKDLETRVKTVDLDKPILANQCSPKFDESTFYKMKPGPALDVEAASVITMKRESSTKLPSSNWNEKKVLDEATQRRVAGKIAKRLFLIPGIRQMRYSTVVRLGKIIEGLLRELVGSLGEYQRQVLDLLKLIEKEGKAFYFTYLHQGNRTCEVRRLKLLLGQRIRCD